MFKISSVLLICLLFCGIMSIELQGKQNYQKETLDQSLKNIEVQKIRPIKKSLNIEEDAQEIDHQEEFKFFKAFPSEKFVAQKSLKKQKFSIISKGNRLLSDDYNDQNTNSNDYQDDNDRDDSNNGNSNCAQGRCQTCANNACTQCKLDQYGQEKYLLVNGRCYESDNHTNDDRHEVDSNEKWEDHQNYHEEGQVSYGGRKYKCQAGCKVCNGSADITKCTNCMDGFAMNSTTFKCMRCDDKCVTCSSDSLGNCTSCYPGWTLNGPDVSGIFTCSKCSTEHCGQCDTVNNCTKCKNFYFRQSETTCESCLSNCRICYNSSSCQQCFSGYFLTQVNGAQSCVLCASGCASCSSLTDCVKCYPGYFMNNSTKVCEKCSSNCWECISSTNCLRCVMGYQLLNYACVSYIEDCAVMNTDNTCKQCFEGYLLSDGNTRCVQNEAHDNYVCSENQYLLNRVCTNCGVAVENCQKCNNQTCLKCKPEYFRESNGTTCTLCRSAMAGCKKCDNSIFCSRCADGYFMEQDRNGSIVLSYGNCIKCDENCLTCNQKGIYCTSCNTGYSLSTARTCVPTNQFDFTLLLNLDLNQFPSKISQFKSDLAKLIKDDSVSQSEKEKFVQIIKITSGSILVKGTFAASSQSALQSTKSTFDTALATGSTFSGIQVLSSDSQERDYEDDHDNDDDNKSSSNTGMIVGIVVGIICAAIVIVAIVVYCFCCKNKVEETEDIKMSDKKSTSTVDDLVATQMIQQSYENNQIHVNSNPEGPQYFV